MMTAKVKITERRNPPPARRKMLPRPALSAGLLVLTTLLAPVATSAQKAERKAVERRLQTEFGEKFWVLRVTQVPLGFSVTVPKPDWQTYESGAIFLLRTQRIKVKKKQIEFEAQRLYFYQNEERELRRFFVPAEKYRLKSTRGKPAPGEMEAAFRKALVSPESVAYDPEKYWPPNIDFPAQSEKAAAAGKKPKSVEVAPGFYTGGKGTSAPRCVYCPEPEFTDAARRAKFSGTAHLLTVVTDQGWVSGIRVVKPAGYGLDEQAVRVVFRYQFKPARRDGRPVAVIMRVEVHFAIY